MPDQSEAYYDVQERLFRLPAPSRAVGRTRSIEGEFQLVGAPAPQLQGNHFRVDLRTLTSDSERRDQLIREQWLESNVYPYAEFTGTHADGLPPSYVEGQEAQFRLTGDMTIRNVTRPVSFDMRGTLTGNTLSGTATTFLLMRDFGFEPPEILNIVRVDDGVQLTVRFVAQSFDPPY
jgi:polyisoprenoid-binding protein YceI